MNRKISGPRMILGRPNRRNGIDPAGQMQYWRQGKCTGTVLIMRPERITNAIVRASAAAHIADWDECIISDRREDREEQVAQHGRSYE